jgi:hypothetical protein
MEIRPEFALLNVRELSSDRRKMTYGHGTKPIEMKPLQGIDIIDEPKGPYEP